MASWPSSSTAPSLKLKDVGELKEALLLFQQIESSTRDDPTIQSYLPTPALLSAMTSLINLRTKRKRVEIADSDDNDDSPSNKRTKDDSLIRPAAVAAVAPAEAPSDDQGQPKDDSAYLTSRKSNASGFVYAIEKDGTSLSENIWKEANDGIGAAKRSSNFKPFTAADEFNVIGKEDDEEDNEEDAANIEDEFNLIGKEDDEETPPTSKTNSILLMNHWMASHQLSTTARLRIRRNLDQKWKTTR